MSGFVDGFSTSGRDFSVLSQKVEIEVDFATQSFKGRTEIWISPLSRELRTIRLNCRQCKVTFLTVADKAATLKHNDPYSRARPHPSYNIHQHHLLRSKLEPQLKLPPEEDLSIILPKSLQIKDLDPFSVAAQEFAAKVARTAGDVSADTSAAVFASETATQFAPLLIVMKFETKEVRDGLHFVGLQDGDTRYPHVYTRNSSFPGTACSIFPCVDDATSRCPWEICVKTPRTLGDAFRAKTPKHTEVVATAADKNLKNAAPNGHPVGTTSNEAAGDVLGLSEREKALELQVICSGQMEEAEVRRITIIRHPESNIARSLIKMTIGSKR